MRRWIVILVGIIVLSYGVVRGVPGFEVRGQLTANETEMQEGYFAVAQDTVLMVRPGTPLHQWLKTHAGQPVRVVVEPVTTR